MLNTLLVVILFADYMLLFFYFLFSFLVVLYLKYQRVLGGRIYSNVNGATRLTSNPIRWYDQRWIWYLVVDERPLIPYVSQNHKDGRSVGLREWAQFGGVI